jgi:hypothetical protein
MSAGGVNAAPFPIRNDTTLDPKLSHYCAPRHWDPTMIFRRSVPGGMGTGSSLALPMDPRPWTKICLQYVNSSPDGGVAPNVPASLVIPGAGEFYPPNRYSEAITNESVLRRLDRPLNDDLLPKGVNPRCPGFPQYTMPANSDSLQQYSLLPPQMAPKSKMARSLADPPVLERNGQYKCSEEAMVCNLNGAPRFFNNFTKLSKYNQRNGACANTLWQYANGQDPSAENLPRPVPGNDGLN